MKWTHPLCDKCWDTEEPDRSPVRLINASSETCCMCGEATKSGIFVRRHPNEVNHLTPD